MARPTVNANPVANAYADKRRERISEFSAPDGGGLISIRAMDDGTTLVSLYRLDDNVRVSAAPGVVLP